MSNLYFGKISEKLGEQHEHNFYAAGEKGSPWYNNIEVGDYVFPIYKGRVSKLWRVTDYGDTPFPGVQFDKKSVLFEVIKQYNPSIHLASEVSRYKYFSLNLNLLNKASKHTASQKRAFFKIGLEDNIPKFEEINFNDLRTITLTILDNGDRYNERDIIINFEKLGNGINKDYRITGFSIKRNNSFHKYEPLSNLCPLPKSPPTLKNLLAHAKKNKNPRKVNYLEGLIEDLDTKGYFEVTNPTALYDNVLVNIRKDVDTGGGEGEELESEFEKYEEFVDLLDFNPNLILFGPPGTGKTYAIKGIISAMEERNSPAKKPASYKLADKEGRVKFITFHQSYSYEEFVEGLRPKIPDEDSKEESKSESIEYEIKPGVLKNLVNQISFDLLKSDSVSYQIENLTPQSAIYKISLGLRSSENNIYKRCKKENEIAIGWFSKTNLSDYTYEKIYSGLKGETKDYNPVQDANTIDTFINKINIGDIVFVYNGPYTIRDIGIVQGPYFFDENDPNGYSHKRKVKWIKEFKEPFNIRDFNNNVRLTLKTIYELKRITFEDLVKILDIQQTDESKLKLKPYYLIIDEINRGNISKVFGELITLIEKDKRDGNLSVNLPYSQKPFTIPSNLYIIGTMNTADRSIAILDSALRRRFVFKEVTPEPELLKTSDTPKINDIDLTDLLTVLNKKITSRYDQDHQIGHAYFFNTTNLSSLKKVWYYQIIPLLKEYFYDENKLISEIIGSDFINKDTGEVHWLADEDFVKAITAIYRNDQ